MSRPVGVVDEYAPPNFIDREALMMDGGRLFFQLTTEDSGGGGTNTLQQGQILTDAGGQRWIAVNTGFGWRMVPEGERATATSGIKLPATSTWITETGSLIEVSGSGQIVGSRALPASQFFGTGGGGGAAPSFGSTQAAQTQAEAAARAAAAQAAKVEAEAAAARRRFEEEQAEIDRELRLREARLTTARDLVNIRSAEAREARTQGVSLAGEDPFKFTAISRGLAGPTGTTPSAAFKGNLAQAGNFQAPELEGLDSAALESVIGKLSQSITPAASPFGGFAHGGTVSAAGVGGPNGSKAIRVGEAGPEILILRPDGSVEVVPEAGSAQFGGEFDLGGFASLFRDLRGSAGITNPQILRAGPGAASGFGSILQSGIASQLGARQRGFGSFVRQGNDPTVFMVTSTGLRSVGSRGIFEGALGGSFGDVESLTPDQFARLQAGTGTGETFTAESAQGFQPQRAGGTFGAFGEPLNTAFGFGELANAIPGFSQQDAARISQLIGFLPAPFKIPVSFFQTLGPTEQTALISAYRLAGVPEADFQHLRTAPQLSATPQRATAVG